MNNKTMQAIKISALAVVISLGIGYALAWTVPTATPPGGNVSPPINASTTPQIKLGPLTLGSLGGNPGQLILEGAGSKITFFDGSTLSTSEPLIQFFKASPDTIQSGQPSATAVLSWQTKGMRITPAPCTISGIGGPYVNLPQTSAISVLSLTGPGSFTFNLSCVGLNGTTVQETATVNVLAPFSQTFSNGGRGIVNIPYGVTKLTFTGSGGRGGGGYYNAFGTGGTISILPGNLGSAGQSGLANGVGGYGGSGGSTGGAGGLISSNGASGAGCGFGGGGFGASASNTALNANGGQTSYMPNTYISGGGGGGGAYAFFGDTPIIVIGGGGGGPGYQYGGGGGGGYGGGGGGGSNCVVAGGGGGGGGSFLDPDFTAVVSDARSILLSQIGSGLVAPTSIVVGAGAGATMGYTAYNGTGGTMTVSW